ncbi:formin-like protein 13 isoform X2 [Electrophorus electricus]|uniref:formin-like protein 13 isoform X2 n=1 Tax=Electrophorus electricus TaxID=8005 RepID=UPI000F0A399D|nr:formin-like protein 13 isoform X2 [Electrophorus electricus]
MDNRHILDVPQLSNEMQLSIMQRVKSGELSIDDALNQARSDRLRLLEKSFDLEEKQASQYNFSVHKFSLYRWQKRVFQIDFSTKTVCSIEKGIVKRQFLFAMVKNCHDAAGTKLTVSFKCHHDYELEAMSPQDKHKILELIHQIIYRNIHPTDLYEEPTKLPASPLKLHEGQLLLQRGGLASCRWQMFKAHLQAGQLTLLPVGCEVVPGDEDGPASSSQPIIIHLSDGGAKVESHSACDAFSLITNKNKFHFLLPMTGHTCAEEVRAERDAWVEAIGDLCVEWKRKSQREHMYEDLKLFAKRANIGDITKEHDCEAEAGRKQYNHRPALPLRPPILESVLYSVPLLVPLPASSLQLASGPVLETEYASEFRAESVPENTPLSLARSGPVLVPQAESRPSPVLSLSLIPPPPPLAPPLLPKKKEARPPTGRTKAFHWDLIAQDKIAKSVWARGSPREIEIDTMRLYEQFGVSDSGPFSNLESSSHVEILLNPKIAHNFNIFLKSFPVQPKDLKDKLFIVNEREGGLSDEHIASLRRYVPTPDDIEMYKSYKGEVNDLHVVDQYMMELCNIPYLSTQLDLLLTLRELPISIEDLNPLISQKIRMCRNLWDSESFVCVLEYLLAVGNYLNQHAGKDKAKGFRLSSLTKLSQLRGSKKQFTLLHALVEQVMLHKPHLATFYQELAEFETVPGASIKGLTAEVDVVKNELQKVIQYRKEGKWKSPGGLHAKFSKDLKMAIEKYHAELSQLTKRCEEMRKLYTDILVKFGEPLNQDSQELFGWHPFIGS